MTVTTTTNKAVYQGNGATTVWGFNFSYPNTSSIQVSLVNNASGNTTVVPAINYTITALTSTSGQVTYPLSGSPIAVGTTLVIERIVPLLQQTDLTNQGGVYPEDIEDALDYLTMEVQQIADKQARSIVFSAAENVAPTLPVASARANMVLGFDSSGAPIAVAGLTPGTTVSAAMIPVVTAPTTDAALAALGLPGNLLALLIPAGTVWDYTGNGAAPAGFVYPGGQPCTSSYPVYRALLISGGSPYGNNGTDPLMPDLRSVVMAGKSNMFGPDNGLLPGGTVLGAILGVANRVLVTGNLPPYTPTGNIAITDPGHVHDYIRPDSGGSSYPGGGTFQLVTRQTSSSVTGITATFNGIGQGGSSTAFSIVQPTFVCNKILKVH